MSQIFRLLLRFCCKTDPNAVVFSEVFPFVWDQQWGDCFEYRMRRANLADFTHAFLFLDSAKPVAIQQWSHSPLPLLLPLPMPTTNCQFLPSWASPPAATAATCFFLPYTQIPTPLLSDRNCPCLRVKSCLSLLLEWWHAAWGSRSVRWGLSQIQGNSPSLFLPLSKSESRACVSPSLSLSAPRNGPLPALSCKTEISISLLEGWGMWEVEGKDQDSRVRRVWKQCLWRVCRYIAGFLLYWSWTDCGRPASLPSIWNYNGLEGDWAVAEAVVKEIGYDFAYWNLSGKVIMGWSIDIIEFTVE